MFHIACLPYVYQSDNNSVNPFYSQWVCLSCSADIFPYNHIEDDNTFKETSKNWIKHLNLQFLIIKDYEFNPFELNDSDILAPIFDCDPDLQYFNDQTCIAKYSCDYYLKDTFKKKVT